MKKYSQTSKNEISNKIEFTYIHSDANIEKIKNICNIAKERNYYAVCVRPDFITDAKSYLEHSNVKIVCVIDFPEIEGGKIGQKNLKVKMKDIRKAILDGVDEVDVAIDTKSYIKADDKTKITKDLTDEIIEMTHYCSANGVLIKIVLETGILLESEIKNLCDICVKAGVHFIMTSTGYGKVGAELEKVKYMRRILPNYIEIKASGGIRTKESAEEFLKYVDRIGTSTEL